MPRHANPRRTERKDTGPNQHDTGKAQQLTYAMLAALGDVPIERIQSLVSDFAKGYATPRVDVRGAVIRNQSVLLVREGTDGLWTLPGGFADVGMSAGENIVKEVWEEARIHVEATGLFGVRHNAKHEYDADVRDFYKMMFVCRQCDDSDPRPSGLETTEVGFFGLGELPPLSTGRILEKDIIGAFDYVESGGRNVFFD